MVGEVLELLHVVTGQWYVDATLGSGGHTEAILEQGGNVLGIEQDARSISRVTDRLKRFGDRVRIENARFSQLTEIVRRHQLEVRGVLFDLGFSSDQLEDPTIGMSFQLDADLDMRLDPELAVTAADLVNGLTERELVALLQEYGEVDRSRSIAHALITERASGAIKTTGQLKHVVERVYHYRWSGKIHPATRVFQALRIAVNGELEQLSTGLEAAVEVLSAQGRVVVLSFHSLEDRIVKRFMSENSALNVITPKPLQPSETEVNANPRSRSTKLRAAEKKE